MSRSIDFAADDHPESDTEKPPVHWVVAISDDCPECSDLRVALTLEEAGRSGAGLAAHLSPASARRLRASLGVALRELGAEPGE